MAKLSKGFLSVSSVVRYLVGRVLPQRIQSYTENEYWSNSLRNSAVPCRGRSIVVCCFASETHAVRQSFLRSLKPRRHRVRRGRVCRAQSGRESFGSAR